MRTRTLAVAAVVPFFFLAVPPVHAAGADDNGCVSRSEYSGIDRGDSLRHVQRDVGTRGKVVSSAKKRGVTTVQKEYHSCAGLVSTGDTVHVRYDDHVKRGSLRVVGVKVDDNGHDVGDDNGVDPVHHPIDN